VATLTTAGWFNNLNFGTTTFNPGTTTLNIANSLTLSATGAYLTLTPVPQANVTYTFNSASFGPLAINTTFTVTLGSAANCTTFVMTAGTLNFALFNLTCSSTATYNGGTLSNIGTISCTTFIINGPSFNFTSGTINPSTGFTLTSGSFTLGGTATIGLFAGTFTHTAGTVTFNKDGEFATVATYLFTAGTINISSGFTVFVGVFSSANTNTRSIAFGTSSAGNINLTGSGTTLSMATVTGFTWTGPGGFETDNAQFNIATLSFGNTAGGSTTTAPNLSFTNFGGAGGTNVQTITTGSWFNNLNFGSAGFNPGTTALNIVGSLTLSSAGAYSALTPTMLGTGTITSNSKTIPALIINSTSGTTTLGDALSLIATGTTTLTSGTLALNGFNLSTGIFSSSGATTRAISFGTGNINLTHTTSATVVLSIGIAGGFSLSGTGGFTADALVARTYQFGSTSGGTGANAPNLTFTGVGAASATITACIFNKLDFGTTAFTVVATIQVYVASLTLSTSGTYTSLSINWYSTGTITPNGKAIGALTAQVLAGTATLAGNLSCTTYTQTSGNVDFATFNLSCSSTGLFTSGTLTNVGTITCTTFTVAGAFAHADGTITPSVSFVTTGGSYTQSGTSVLSAVPTFTQTAGDVTFRSTYSLTATGTYTLTAGTLTLGGNLTTGIFSSSGAGTRSIAFGTYNVVLGHTTAATTVLSMADITNFTPTGTGGFAADASITRTFTSGTTGGSTTRAPNLSLTGSGTAIATLTTGSWFNTLNFGTTAFAIAVTALNLNGLTLSSSGTYTNLTPTARGTGTFTSNGKTVAALVVDAPTYTVTTADALTITGALTLTAGALACSTYAVQSATFASTGALTRSITGSGTYTITGSGATAFSNASATGITITGLIISMTAATAKTFAGGGGSFSTLNQGGAGALTISGNNSFADITATTRPSTITFTAGSTQTVANFTLSGILGSLVTINSTSPGTRFILSRASGTVSVGFLNIEDSNATGGANWYADVTSFNVGNNLGWIFTAPPGFTGAANFFLFF
jgi:hypothetical protein